METVPRIAQWSPVVAADIALDVKLDADERAAKAEDQRLLSLNGIDPNREVRAAMIASGQTPGPAASIKAQRDEVATRLSDIKLAREIHRENSRKHRLSEGNRLCEELKPSYETNAKKFAEDLAGIYGFLLETDGLRSSLMSQDIGFYPVVCNLDTDSVFGNPRDPGSPIVRLLRECVHFGYLSKLPNAGLR